MNDLERFDGHVKVENDCWLWQAAMTGKDKRTPYFSVGGRMRTAARWIWEQAYGPVPPRRCVRNSCGDYRCVNPEHHYVTDRRSQPEGAHRLPPLQGPPRPQRHQLTLEQRVVASREKYLRRLAKQGSECVDCGVTVTPGAERCRGCWDVQRTKVYSRTPEKRLRHIYQAWKLRRTGTAG